MNEQSWHRHCQPDTIARGALSMDLCARAQDGGQDAVMSCLVCSSSRHGMEGGNAVMSCLVCSRPGMEGGMQ
jgi:hypothetical protein